MVILLADALSSASEKYPAIAPHVAKWRSDLSWMGPGMIDLHLDDVAASAEAREELVQLTGWLESKVLALGERLPASILNELSPRPGIKFFDYPTKLLSTTLTRLRQLVAEPTH